MDERQTTHADFSIERIYDASPQRVFHAFADTHAKSKWFHGPREWGPAEHKIDFRVGGRESNRGGPKGGVVHAFEAQFWDIVPDRRIIFSYDMFLGDTRISVSLATVEIEPQGKGTRLVFTEQGVYLGGYVDGGSRERGTAFGLDRLGESLTTTI